MSQDLKSSSMSVEKKVRKEKSYAYHSLTSSQSQNTSVSEEKELYEIGKLVASLIFLLGFQKAEGFTDAANLKVKHAYVKLGKIIKSKGLEGYPTLDVLMADFDDAIKQLQQFLNDIRIGMEDRKEKCAFLGYHIEIAKNKFNAYSFAQENPNIGKMLDDVYKQHLSDLISTLEFMLEGNNMLPSLLKQLGEIETLISSSDVKATSSALSSFTDELETQLFTVLEQHPVVPEKYSEIDRSRSINNRSWVLSIVRKPDGTHAEHAFLILEGQENDCNLIWFMDFVTITKGKILEVLTGNGKIRIASKRRKRGDLGKSLLFRCRKEMMDVNRGQRILYNSWSITKDQARQLIREVEAEEKQPPKFNILGRKSIFAGSTAGSSCVERGHNCFTWAREKIMNLDDERIIIPELMSNWIVVGAVMQSQGYCNLL